uniref:SGNH/GDSL hydrolase family protein n=1 Tax=Geobacillus sp. (strain WCH70) TaxID=471223 RepID=C5D960_GEOSW
MIVKNFLLTVLLLVSCVSFIIAGQLYWQKKIDDTVKQAMAEAPKQEAIENESKLMKYAAQLPSEVQEKIKNAIHTNHPVRLVIVGSEAISSSEKSWPALFKNELESTYGQQVFEVVVKEYGEMTTKEALEANVDKEIIDAKPDILLWEPFILNNNGVIEIEDTLQQIDTIIQNIQSALPDVTIMLQPPHPIYNARYYPSQVEQLQSFAKEKGYIYLDHWKAWPDYKSEELNDVVNENTDLPNERGHQLWADFLIDYFIAK